MAGVKPIVLAFQVLLTASLICSRTRCPPAFVPLIQIGDGKCDLSCMTAACEFDRNDCASLCECPTQLLGNGVCDPGKDSSDCGTQECGWDFGDCGYCAYGC